MYYYRTNKVVCGLFYIPLLLKCGASKSRERTGLYVHEATLSPCQSTQVHFLHPWLAPFFSPPLIPTPARLDRRENDENGQCPIYTSEWGYHRPGRASAKPAAARHCFLSHQHRHHQCHPALLKWFLFWTWSATQGFLEADSGTEAPWCGQLCLGETKTEADGSVSVCFQSSYEIG